MKIFIILSLLFFKQLCSENISVSNPVSNECEQKHRQLVLENEQLKNTIAELRIENQQFQKTVADLRTENANLKSDLYESSALANEAKLLSQNFKIIFNEVQQFNMFLRKHLSDEETYSRALSRDAKYLSHNLKTLSDDVNLFNSYVDNQFANYAMRTGLGESLCQCMPMKFSQLKFIDTSLYTKVCDVKKSNGDWTVIQRRIDGSVNFTRGWADYKAGFGTITGEFFIGLDSLHLLTTCAPQELLIEMEGGLLSRKGYAKYDLFLIGDETEQYKMKELGEYEGDMFDSLSYHKSQKFSTFDQDNDESPENCARIMKGGWWYKYCLYSHLYGQYGNNEFGKVIYWPRWRGGSNSFKKVEMKIRPKK